MFSTVCLRPLADICHWMPLPLRLQEVEFVEKAKNPTERDESVSKWSSYIMLSRKHKLEPIREWSTAKLIHKNGPICLRIRVGAFDERIVH